jgi:hypothetical protein
MKNTTILLTLLLGLNVFGQNKNFQAFLITSEGVSATPISIPSPNKSPIHLTFYESRIVPFTNKGKSDVTGCAFLDFKDKKLTIRVFHTLKSQSKAPIYVGAWFYNQSKEALDVGYLPKIISQDQPIYTDIILSFNELPMTTNYLEVMLFQNGKTIVKRRFKTSYEWKEVTEHTAIMQVGEITTIKDIQIAPENFKKYKYDLELTDIRIQKPHSGGVVRYPSTCLDGVYHVFITNIGSLTSEPYEVSVGYYETLNDVMNRFVEIERFKKPTLLAGKQTYCKVMLPHDTNNIEARIVYKTINNKDNNSKNNTLLKRCTMARN